MKRIGLLGGRTFETSMRYFEDINNGVNARLGGRTSADLVLRSPNTADYEELYGKKDWSALGKCLHIDALDLVIGQQCDYIALASVEAHKVARTVKDAAEKHHTRHGALATFVDVADVIADECRKVAAHHVLLLGTKPVMEGGAITFELVHNHGLRVMSTSNYPDEIAEIDRIITKELFEGYVYPGSVEFLVNFINVFPSDSEIRPDAVILANSELSMALSQELVDATLIDATAAHINKLIELTIEENT